MLQCPPVYKKGIWCNQSLQKYMACCLLKKRKSPKLLYPSILVLCSEMSCNTLKVKVKLFSHIQLFVTSWTIAYQAPLSMGFSRQEYWSGLPLPSPRNLPDPGIEPGSPTLYADALPTEPPGKSIIRCLDNALSASPYIKRCALGFPGGTVVKNPPANARGARDVG